MSKNVSRKEFFKQSAKFAAGISAGAVGLNALSAKKAFADSDYTWPFPYTNLDPEAVRILGHDSYWNGMGCSCGAFHAIVESLRTAIGTPFTEVPSELLFYGHGGGVGWGTVCGAINGAAAAISLVCQKADTNTLASELYGWYTQTLFPSDISNQYAVNHTFTNNTCDIALTQNASGSPLCHVSVSEWCVAAATGVDATERKERCGRLTGDVAAYAVKILNDHFAGQFTPQYVAPASVAACLSCHDGAANGQVAAKMECTQCHGTDPHANDIGDVPAGVATDYELKQNYPNPFNPETKIDFTLPKSERVDIEVYDLNGRLIQRIARSQAYTAGTHTVQWNGKDQSGRRVASGMYYYHIKAGKFNKTKNMMLIK